MEYLIASIVDNTDHPFSEVHNFVRDRTRSIRQDFTYQGVRNDLCMDIHEKCVRFHILSNHRLCGEDPEVFQSKQNLEQLDKCLISLREMYSERQTETHVQPANEAEMQSYFLLTHTASEEVVGTTSLLRDSVKDSNEVRFALMVVTALKAGDYISYFRLLQDAPYLTACIMHQHAHTVRVSALAKMRKCFRDPLPVELLCDQLGFDSKEETLDFLAYSGVEANNGFAILRSEVVPESTTWKLRRSERLVEAKCRRLRPSQIMEGRGKGLIKPRSLKVLEKRTGRISQDTNLSESRVISEDEPRRMSSNLSRIVSSLRSPRITSSPIFHDLGVEENPPSLEPPMLDTLSKRDLKFSTLFNNEIVLGDSGSFKPASPEHPIGSTSVTNDSLKPDEVLKAPNAGPNSMKRKATNSEEDVNMIDGSRRRKIDEKGDEEKREEEEKKRTLERERERVRYESELSRLKMEEQERRMATRKQRRKITAQVAFECLNSDLSLFEKSSSGPTCLAQELVDLRRNSDDPEEAAADCEAIIELAEYSSIALEKHFIKLEQVTFDGDDREAADNRRVLLQRVAQLAETLDFIVKEAKRDQIRLCAEIRRRRMAKAALRYELYGMGGFIPNVSLKVSKQTMAGLEKRFSKVFEASSRLPTDPIEDYFLTSLEDLQLDRFKLLVGGAQGSRSLAWLRQCLGGSFISEVSECQYQGARNTPPDRRKFVARKTDLLRPSILEEGGNAIIYTMDYKCSTGEIQDVQGFLTFLRQLSDRMLPILIVLLSVDALGHAMPSFHEDKILELLDRAPVSDFVTSLMWLDVSPDRQRDMKEHVRELIKMSKVQGTAPTPLRSSNQLLDVAVNVAFVTLMDLLEEMRRHRKLVFGAHWTEVMQLVYYSWEDLTAQCRQALLDWAPEFGQFRSNLESAILALQHLVAAFPSLDSPASTRNIFQHMGIESEDIASIVDFIISLARWLPCFVSFELGTRRSTTIPMELEKPNEASLRSFSRTARLLEEKGYMTVSEKLPNR